MRSPPTSLVLILVAATAVVAILYSSPVSARIVRWEHHHRQTPLSSSSFHHHNDDTDDEANELTDAFISLSGYHHHDDDTDDGYLDHHDGDEHGEPGDQTLLELLKSHGKFNKIVEYIEDDEELKDLLSKDDDALTVFAPTDDVFERIAQQQKRRHIPKEVIKKIILYHFVPETLCTYAVGKSRVLDTLLISPELNDQPQKLKVTKLWKKILINHALITVPNLRASNGIIHGVNRVVIPPFDIVNTTFVFPIEFSTFTSAIQKVGLVDEFKDAKAVTLFAPTNGAFARLGHRALAYLFSPWGKKALRTILLYHISPELVYSTDLLPNDTDSSYLAKPARGHLEIDSFLEGKKINIDTVQVGDWLVVTVNGASRVLLTDAVSKNGVIHVINKVLLPPRSELDLDNLPDFNQGDFERYFPSL